MTTPGEARATNPGADPVADHVAALAAALHGPEPLKARMLGELRDGLADTAAALRDEGLPADRAAARAVLEFGTVEEIAPGFQRELTIAQARRTARAVALTVPSLLACWHLLGAAPARDRRLAHTAQFLAEHVGGIAVAAALLAAAALAVTGALGRRLPVPSRLPLAVAWSGTAAGVALGVSALALTAASALAGNWPLSALLGALTVVTHAKVAASARACRYCARLPAA